MEWKEIFIVSSIIGVISYFFTFTNYLQISSPLFGVIAAGLVLNKKLSPKSSWGIFIGMILTGLISIILELLFWLFS